MHFTDHGIILSVRKLSEHGGVVRALSKSHGVVAGVDRYALSSKRRATYQQGNLVQINWQARLAEHLGTLTTELIHSPAARMLDDPLKLAVLQSACHLSGHVCEERDPHHPEIFASLSQLIDALAADDYTHHAPDYLSQYLKLELALLKAAGFGLDLSRCAATGQKTGLVYVSPKTGRAVSEKAGYPYRDKLLPLPVGLVGDAPMTFEGVEDGLKVTGYFFETRFFENKKLSFPPARETVARLVKRMGRQKKLATKEKLPTMDA